MLLSACLSSCCVSVSFLSLLVSVPSGFHLLLFWTNKEITQKRGLQKSLPHTWTHARARTHTIRWFFGWKGHCGSIATNPGSPQHSTANTHLHTTPHPTPPSHTHTQFLSDKTFLVLKPDPSKHTTLTHTHAHSFIEVDYPHLQMYGFVTDPLAKLEGAVPNELFSPSLRVKTGGKYAC